MFDSHPGVELHLLRDVAEPFLGFGTERPRVLSENADPPRSRTKEAEEALDEGRFSRAVRSEEADDRTGRNVEIDPLQDLFFTEGFDEAVDMMMGEVMGCSCRVVPDGGLV